MPFEIVAIADELGVALVRTKGAVRHFEGTDSYPGLVRYMRRLRWLGQAYEDRDYQLPTVKDDIHFSRLRKDPRFEELLNRIGLERTASKRH